MTAAELLARLRAELAREGLFVTRVVTQAALDAQSVELRLGDLLPGARSALVVGDGGGEFFSRFGARRTERARRQDTLTPRQSSHPLDAHTEEVVPAAVARALDGHPFRVHFPFSRDPRLPVQRIGQAAGLPAPGPLGVQIHPRFGPWWAYRALVVTGEELAEEPPLPGPCASCPAPCISICPASAATRGGLSVQACAEHRLRDEGCQLTCVARRSCIVGREHGYPDEQLAFHMGHSLRVVRDYFRS